MRVLSAVLTVAVLVWSLARLSAGIRYLVSERGPQGLRRVVRLASRTGRWLVVRAWRGVVRTIRFTCRLRGDRSRPWLWPRKAVRVRVASGRLRPWSPASGVAAQTPGTRGLRRKR